MLHALRSRTSLAALGVGLAVVLVGCGDDDPEIQDEGSEMMDDGSEMMDDGSEMMDDGTEHMSDEMMTDDMTES